MRDNEVANLTMDIKTLAFIAWVIFFLLPDKSKIKTTGMILSILVMAFHTDWTNFGIFIEKGKDWLIDKSDDKDFYLLLFIVAQPIIFCVFWICNKVKMR